MQAPLIPGTFPLGYCYPNTPQQLIADAFSLAHANVSDNVTGVAYGPTAPDPSVIKLFHSSVFHRMYEYVSGLWVSQYWCEADPKIKMITEKTEAEIAAWDNPNGLVNPAAPDHTGPFWEIDHEYDGRFILGPGGLPVIARTVNVTDEGGLDGVVQAADQLALHRHYINVGPESGDSSYLADLAVSENGTFKVNGAEQIRFYDLPSTEVGRTRETGGNGAAPSVVQPMDNVPPYRAAYVVKRTARIWHTL